ncbi:matrixin family metalloprotease [Haloarcula onubensis]|uniref:Matrixin family metalloprotease n=1 Tax=Haloarcula onubensis TaxID=2950539 RepID=A0ABU2FIE3_9EURY|nr:matrixin family metalloprotease [Halomicroarcula sp. S3CR25-11]MDS0280497.1 matrixin family metalloprotease [Halomicroarcula sp. S3CR25-11]
MDSRRAGVLVALLVLGGLAGCGALLEETDSLSGPDSLTGDGEHPFAGETVTVAVEGSDRERALAADGLAYWADNATEYAGFDVAFRVRSPGATPAREPDVRVRFVETVTACGDTEFPAGCAPRLNASTGVDRPATVQIRRGLANDSTRLVVAHEGGHLLGLTHTDRPRDVMAHERDLATLPRQDAAERANPWNDSTLTVALAGDGRSRYRSELDYALAYVREGADGAVPANLSVRVVDDPATADVVVRPVATDGCTAGEGSCLFLEGTDPDGDGAIETYTGAEIRLVGVDADAAGWHVASQFVETFHTGDDPDRLDGANARERRGDWHG